MCGITGFLGSGSGEVLKRMTDSLAHRGPDDEGFFVDEKNGVHLGMRRLSIIDVGGGRQPMFSEDKKISVVFNGEIYNFKELRKILESGHKFETRSDTEVLVHGYEEWGMDVFRKMRGMFAAAIWDGNKEQLVLARDPFGEKPLYWFMADGTFIFASEPKALFIHPLVKKELDFESLQKYLVFEYVPTPHTIYKGVNRLRPAHFAVWKSGVFKENSYWSVLENNEDAAGIGVRDAQEQLEQKIEEAVRMQLVSDVPLGLFLSGGIDSSTIAYFAQKNSSPKIKTYSIGFDDKDFDESGLARTVASRLGTNHSEFVFKADSMFSAVSSVFELLDEPVADAAILPTFMLAKLSREAGIKVALAGEGGDELFMGYQTFNAAKLSRIYRLIPKPARSFIIEPIVGRLPIDHGYFSLGFKARKFVKGHEMPLEIQNQIWLSAFEPEEWRQIVAAKSGGFYGSAGKLLTDELAGFMNEAGSYSYLSRISYMYLKTYLEGDILVKADRASMMNSFELRAPFLDKELASFVFHLPQSLKYRLFTSKDILKKLMAPKIGRDIAYRRKQGFAVPLARWLAGPLKPLMLELLSEERLKKDGYFNPLYVSKLINEHLAGRNDNRKKLWTLMAFQLWKENWLK